MAAVAAVFAAAAATAQAPRKAQDIYNEAQAAFEAEDWAKAVAGFEEVQRRMKGGNASAASIQARLAHSLDRLGENKRALEQARGAVAAFDRLGISQSEDRAIALIVIGEQLRGQIDLPGSIVAYQQAVAAAADQSNAAAWIVIARWGLVYAALTADPALAAQTLDLIAAERTKTNAFTKEDNYYLNSMRGLAELNRGDAKTAGKYVSNFANAETFSNTVKLRDVQARGNAALILSRLHQPEQVRRLLAYSGAGRIDNSTELAPADADLPICGEEVTPTDYAVVEFAIGDNGRTAGVAPLYASRPGVIGAAFATSVQSWRWNPEALAKLPLFWRAAVRMELRCTKRPEPTRLSQPFFEATHNWLEKQNVRWDASSPDVTFSRVSSEAKAMTDLSTAIVKWNDAKKPEAMAVARDDLRRRLVAMNAPVEVEASFLFISAQHGGDGTTRRGYATRRSEALAPLIDDFGKRPGAERVVAWLRTERAIQEESLGHLPGAQAEFMQVTKLPTSTLPADDPVRTVATLHLSMLERRAGQNAAADQRLADSGIGAAQCSLLDIHPIQQSGSVSSTDFPAEALRWGFEGYVRTAYDIDAQGRVQDVRTIIAYPPFVFDEATEKAFARFRYSTPVMDGQPIGCVEQVQKVRYHIPH